MTKDVNSYNLRQNILRMLNVGSVSEINQSKFAESAGVSKNHMLKVLSGDTNNPGIKTIIAIAERLDCSIDELVGYKSSKKQTFNLVSSDLKINTDLLKNSFNYIIAYIIDNNLSPNIGDIITALDNIYDHSFRRNLTSPDTHFAEWILSSTFNMAKSF